MLEKLKKFKIIENESFIFKFVCTRIEFFTWEAMFKANRKMHFTFCN